MTRFAIVTTTIYVPKLLEKYTQNFRFYGHDDVFFVVISDKKTPTNVGQYCHDLEQKYGYKIIYMNVDAQIEYLQQFPKLGEHLPWNSIQRRNIGLIIAYQEQADVIVTIDDDNLITNQDFLGKKAHGIVKQVITVPTYESSTGWLNICEFLQEEHDIKFHHRGYPIDEKTNDREALITREEVTKEIVVNEGFWLDDPDIDAITRMVNPVRVVGMKNPAEPNIALAPGTWSPFNSQNTALARKVIPAYFLSPYIGRYDDIWASYLLRKIMDHFGHLGTYGQPVVCQVRNPHDLFVDLDKERVGMELSGLFCQHLREVDLVGKTYLDCYRELQVAVEDFRKKDQNTIVSRRGSLEKFVEGMKIWIDLFETIQQ